MKRLHICLPAAAALFCGALSAQTIYRCGNTYSEHSCPDAKIIGPALTASPESEAAAERSRQFWARQQANLEHRDAVRAMELRNAPGAIVIPTQRSALPDRDYRNTWSGGYGGYGVWGGYPVVQPRFFVQPAQRSQPRAR